MMMVRSIVSLLAVLVISTTAIGQKLALDLYAFPTVTNDFKPAIIAPYSGIGLSVKHGNKQQFQGGLSFRSVPWGAELSISEGLVYRLVDHEKYTINNTTKIFLGYPLFYNKLSISTGLSSEFYLSFRKFERVFLSAGMRYNLNPAYQKISRNYKLLEGLLGLHITLWK